MNTDRSSSFYTRRLASRTIAAYNASEISRNNLTNQRILRTPITNFDSSVITYTREGGILPESTTSVVSSSSSASVSAPAPAPAPTSAPASTPTGFIPTTWVDADGVDFSIVGRCVAYGKGKWIAAGVDSTATIKASTDNALTWVDVDNQLPITNGGGSGVYGVATDGNGNWVAVGNQNTLANAVTILYSSDNGETWLSNPDRNSGFNIASPSAFSDRGWGVTYANGLWMAVGHYTVGIGYERNIKLATSFDPINGPNWVNSPPGVTNNPVFGVSNPGMCVAYGNGVWCVGGQDLNPTPKGSIFYSTDNGISWTKATNSFKGQCQGIATDGNGNWVAVGQKAAIDAKPIKYSSDNGMTWSDTTTADSILFTNGVCVAYAQTSSGGVWVAGGLGGSYMVYSTDNGLTWSPAGSNRLTQGIGIHFAGDRWVAVGNRGEGSIKYSVS